jgi:hypothetical protein
MNGSHRKHPLSIVVVQLLQLPSKGLRNTVSNSNSTVVEACLPRRCVAIGCCLVVWRSLPSNGSICNIIIIARSFCDNFVLTPENIHNTAHLPFTSGQSFLGTRRTWVCEPVLWQRYSRCIILTKTYCRNYIIGQHSECNEIGEMCSACTAFFRPYGNLVHLFMSICLRLEHAIFVLTISPLPSSLWDRGGNFQIIV